jgi:hypothetical protein
VGLGPSNVDNPSGGLLGFAQAIPPLPIHSLQWMELGSKFDPGTVRPINRIMGNLQITTLREHIDLLSNILEQELKLSITGAELSPVFGRKGSWADEMIAEHIHQLDSLDPFHPEHPRLADVPLEDNVTRFCLRRQQERQSVMFSNVIDSLAEKSNFVNRFWAYCFVPRHREKIAVQRAKYLEKERHEIAAEDLKVYFASITAHLTSFRQNGFGVLMKLVRVPQNISPPGVTVANGTRQRLVIVPDNRDDVQLTLLTAIWALGDFTSPYFISK